MADIGLTLDISHMDEQAVLPALDAYPGPIIASHANPAALLKGIEGSERNRFLPDRVIGGLLERDGVIGVIPYNRFLLPGWKESHGRERVPLERVVAQIDYICQMAGDADHVGIGSDFDGGFGLQKTPAGIDTIADLHKITPLLAQKGYSPENIAAILGKNWLRYLKNDLPKG